MRKLIIVNAFSMNMIAEELDSLGALGTSAPVDVRYTGVSETIARGMLKAYEWESAIGHQTTADILTARLGTTIPMNRTNIMLEPDVVLLCAQVAMPRLPEGHVLSAEELSNVRVRYALIRRTTLSDRDLTSGSTDPLA